MNDQMKLQRRLSNGTWMALADEYVDQQLVNALAREQDIAQYDNRTPMTTVDELLEALRAGEELSTDTNWYASIRMEPAPRVTVPVEMVDCRCGHRVRRSQVMSASRGTACPDCYDRMSY